MSFPAPSIKLPGQIGMNLKIIFCFGHVLAITRFGELYGFSYRLHNWVRHINLAGPLLIRAYGIGNVMGYERMTTGFIITGPWMLNPLEQEAYQCCRERYMNLGEYTLP